RRCVHRDGTPVREMFDRFREVALDFRGATNVQAARVDAMTEHVPRPSLAPRGYRSPTRGRDHPELFAAHPMLRADEKGPTFSALTVPSSVTKPRAWVSWRRRFPLGRMEKIWSPLGFVPNGSQLEWNVKVPVAASRPNSTTRHPGGVVVRHRFSEYSGSEKCVSCRKSAPTVLMEKS